MKFLMLTLALLGDPGSAPSPLPAATVQEIAASVQTGSILASQGDCLAVRAYSLSSYTHVGTVVVRNGQPFVYDTMPGSGVRCQPLNDYLLSQRPTDMQVLHPAKPFATRQVADFEQHLNAQLGRPYDIKHFATGYRAKGLHCSEYLTDALIASQHLTAKNPVRVSPGELIDCLTENQIYQAGGMYDLPAPPTEPVDPATTWYGKAWQGTKSCTYDCWVQTKRWFCCK